jgi:hypothetical protein
MRIGIDGSCLSNRRGFGRFARELLEAMARSPRDHELTLFLDRPSMETVTVPLGIKTVAVDVKQAPSRAAAASGRR